MTGMVSDGRKDCATLKIGIYYSSEDTGPCRDTEQVQAKVKEMEWLKEHLNDVVVNIIAGLIAAGLLSLAGFVFRSIFMDSRLAIILVAALGWLICLYVVWRKGALWSAQKRASKKKRQRQKQISTHAYRWGRIGLVAIPVITAAVLGVYQYQLNHPSAKLVVLVAEFDGPDPKNYRVTEAIVDKLEAALEPYQDEVEVRRLHRTITSTEGNSTAAAEGQKAKASIVIWGWYGATGTTVPLNVNFGLIGDTVQGISYCGSVDEIRTYDQSELDSFSLQVELSDELAYLTLFTVGMTRYQVRDWQGAIEHFTDAAQYSSEWIESGPALSLHYYRGYSFLNLKDYHNALGSS
ncbi:hypothetical protein ACFLYD_08305 [Chloroflexota bacterium]